MPLNSTALNWSLVAKNFTPDDLLKQKLQQKVAKLEKHLEHFPFDAVHLQVNLERHPKKQQFKAGLTLKLPSNLLHGEKEAPEIMTAFEQAFKALLREVGGFKDELRGD